MTRMLILDRLRAWLTPALALLAGAAAAFGFYQKAQRDRDERKDVEAARKIEQDATKALTDGLTKEQEGQERAKQENPYKHFE